MAQALVETIFDICYLVGVITLGVIMYKNGSKNPVVKKFGLMAILLGAGDAFHLVPRMYALWTTGLEANATALGVGKLITSITMTVFYLILYYIWKEYYSVKECRNLTITMWILTITRIVLCLLPQNEWLSYQQPLFYGILRNIPFSIMGILIIIIFAKESKRVNDQTFKYMSLAVLLSFGFYIPVVLFASKIPLLGMLMIPKTLAYVWVVKMGWTLYKETTISKK